MKHRVVAGLLLAGGLASCEESPREPAATELPGATSEYALRVSGPANTSLVIETRWSGGFGGEAHNEYTLYYVREHGWWQDDERRQLDHWVGRKGNWHAGPVLRRLDATTIAVEMLNEYGKVITSTYTFEGGWPHAELLSVTGPRGN